MMKNDSDDLLTSWTMISFNYHFSPSFKIQISLIKFIIIIYYQKWTRHHRGNVEEIDVILNEDHFFHDILFRESTLELHESISIFMMKSRRAYHHPRREIKLSIMILESYLEISIYRNAYNETRLSMIYIFMYFFFISISWSLLFSQNFTKI